MSHNFWSSNKIWFRLEKKPSVEEKVFQVFGYRLRERIETLKRLNSERCLKGFALVAQFTFQPSRTYTQYDLLALVSIPDIDETTKVALASVDKSMYPSVASGELATITSDYPTENIFL
jgi:hypothetical protein